MKTLSTLLAIILMFQSQLPVNPFTGPEPFSDVLAYGAVADANDNISGSMTSGSNVITNSVFSVSGKFNIPGWTTVFANLPACGSFVEGSYPVTVTDSTTNTWGATITGSSSNVVQAFCDGTNWTVAAK